MGSDLLKKKKKKEKKEKENLTLPQRPAWLDTQCNIRRGRESEQRFSPWWHFEDKSVLQ